MARVAFILCRRLIVAMALLLPLALHAADDARINVTGTVYKDYARIVFNAPAKGTFDVRVNGDALVITLSSPIEANFREAFGPLRDYIASASVRGGREVHIKLKQSNMRVRKFQSSGVFGVDLLRTEEAKKTPEPEKKKEIAATPKAKPVAEPELKKAETKFAPTPRPRPAAEKEKTAEVKKAPEPEKKKEKEIAAAPAKPSEHRELAPVVPATTLARFPFKEPVSAAIFVRGKTLWAVFDKPVRMDVSALVKDGVAEAHQLPDRHNTILQLKLKPEVNPKQLWVWQEDAAWAVGQGVPPVVTPLAVETDLGAVPKVKVKVLQAAEPFTFTDPEVGDELFVVPVRDANNLVSPARRYVEMQLLETLQGVAVRRMSEAPRFKVDREGVTIGSARTLVASEVITKQTMQADITAEEKKTPGAEELTRNSMFPFAENADPAAFMPGYYAGIKSVGESTGADVSVQRRKFAEFFFIHGFYSEALGMLRQILADDPEFSDAARVRDMIAASLYLMGRYDQASETFASLAASDRNADFKDEQRLWQWASNRRDAEDNLARYAPTPDFDPAVALQKYLPAYPASLRREFILLLADQMTEESRTGLARELLDKVASLGPTADETDFAQYLRARALEIERKDDMAIAAYKKLLDRTDNTRVRAMTSLALAKFQKATGKAPLPDVIKTLDAARYEWHGGRTEIDLLRTLGGYYIENKSYIEGLRTWRTLVSNYSGTPVSLEVAGDMARIYADLFDSPEAYKLPPVQALGIFFEFNELMPVGAQGDRISRKLAEHLESVDLLESAAAILTHQVRYRSQGMDRAQLAAKLIELHLSNNRADLATEVLAAMDKEVIPDVLKGKYRALRSELLIREGKYDAALETIKEDSGAEVMELKLAIYWYQQQWEHVIDILEPQIKARAGNQDTLTPAEEQRVLRLAIAYSKLRRWSDVDWIKEAFGKRIKAVEAGDAFDFVTNKMAPVDHNKLDDSLELNRLESFMAKYRKPEPPAPEPAPEAKPEDATKAPAAEEKKSEEKKAEEPAPEAKKEEAPAEEKK